LLIRHERIGEDMGCKCAEFDPDSGRYKCSVSGDGCIYMIPSSKRCAEEYDEGPDAVEQLNGGTRMSNNYLLKLLELIEKYNEGGVLKEEFEAFTCYDEPIVTIEDLIEVMEDEMSCWP